MSERAKRLFKQTYPTNTDTIIFAQDFLSLPDMLGGRDLPSVRVPRAICEELYLAGYMQAKADATNAVLSCDKDKE